MPLILIAADPGDIDAENRTVTEAAFEDYPSVPDNDNPFESFDPDEEIHYYASKEIEENRWISLSHDGVETTETDENVIRILELARHDNSAFRFSESSNFTLDEEPSKEKRAIIGSDNRYRPPRYGLRIRTCTLAYMQNGCTAVLIGPRHALTAGHCLYDHTNRRWRTNIGMYVGRDCSRRGTFAAWSRAWIMNANGDARSNIGLVLLSSTFTSPCWLGFGFQDPMPRTHVETCGYHGDRRSIGTYPCYYCSHCYAELEVVRILGIRITYNSRMRSMCDIYNAPGSPMVVDTGHVWGVHSHESSSYNYAVRITRQRFYTICQWLCDNGARCSARC